MTVFLKERSFSMLKRALLLTVAVGLSVQAHAGDDSRKSLLFPPEGGPLAGARGQVEIEENEFEIKLEEVQPGATYTVLVENADGVLEAVGSATSSSMGRAQLEFEDRLPLGVSMPGQLSGRSDRGTECGRCRSSRRSYSRPSLWRHA
jgi:hypothetical protein